MAYYVFDDAKNLFEGMTKEEIIAAIAQATGVTPENIDDGFITTIQEQNAQHGVKLWVGSQNEYNAIQQPDENTLYCVTDPHETNELQSQIAQLQAEVNELVVQNTENASGYVVGSQTATAENDITTDPHTTYFRKTFTVPENAVILDVSWVHGRIVYEQIPAGAYRYDALNITRTNATTVNVVVDLADIADGETDFDYLTFRISYAYSEAIDLSELTDIRVGYDGTVYGSAGEAVRKQIFAVGFNDYVKSALLNLLAHVAYVDGNGQQYYNALEQAMYMLAGVTSITAVFNQGQNVIYDTDDLDTLRQYLTVTAYFEDNTHEVITGYILSGTIEVGTSEITVSYGGKTTTFNVTVTESDPFARATYERYPWARVGGTTYPEAIYKSGTTAARARISLPLTNPNKTFTVTDPTKYNIAVYNVTSLETVEVAVSGNPNAEAWLGTDNNKSWGTSGSSSAPYVALSFKKLDNTEFTDEELENMYGTVFTLS